MGCVDVTTTENDVLEDVKRFNMHLSSTDTQVVLAPMYAFVTILEDDGKCVCMYVCMYVRMYVCMYIHMCMYVCSYVHTYIHTYIHT